MTKAVLAIAAACAAPAIPLAAAHSTTPSTLWWGVERILVDCNGEESLSPTLESRLCAEVVAEIAGRTAFPVVARGTAARRDPESDLIVRVNARMATESGGRPTLVLSVRPHRYGMGARRGPRPEKIVEGAFDDHGHVPTLQAMITESLEAILP